MLSNEFDLNSLLDSSIVGRNDTGFPEPGVTREDNELDDGSGEPEKIDYRVRQLSYSSLLLLHTCPRKYELYKKRSQHKTPESEKSSITFSYGHVVGLGIQMVLSGFSREKIFFDMFLLWSPDIFTTDQKANKSLWSAYIAIDRFIHMRENGFLDGYVLAYFDGKPATELSFCVSFPDGFRLRGYVDAVLVHEQTGKVLVLELKTTGAASFSPSTYKNSAQGIGYSVVLDVLFPALSSYEVMYLVYQTKTQEYTPLPFAKSYLQRALWIKEILLDIEMIKLYEEHEVYPMHGESCFSYYRDCEYINTCQLSTKYLTAPFDSNKDVDTEEYRINLTLLDLINAQLSKVEA